MSSLLFLHHFYLTLITKSYILYAATQSAIPQGLPPRNHPRWKGSSCAAITSGCACIYLVLKVTAIVPAGGRLRQENESPHRSPAGALDVGQSPAQRQLQAKERRSMGHEAQS